MNKTIMAVGVGAIMMSVVPAFAAERDTKSNNFKALQGITAATPMNDKELASVEGAAPLFQQGQVGLVNVGAQANVQNVRVIRDITIQDINVAVLSAGRQQ